MAQFQFAFGTGNDVPWRSLFLVQPGPDQGQQVLFARSFLRFRRQYQRMPREQVGAPLRFGFVGFYVVKTTQRLNGHTVLAIACVGKVILHRQFCPAAFWQRETVSAQSKDSRLVGKDTVPVELPAAFPPEMRLHTRVILTVSVAQAVH